MHGLHQFKEGINEEHKIPNYRTFTYTDARKSRMGADLLCRAK